jgi:REP element-mobilizing transposase RayT
MKGNRNHRKHKAIRLKGWDYRTPGWYFLTIVTESRRHFFGEIGQDIMGLSEIGCMAYRNWAAIPEHFKHVKLDAFIVMPNHLHGLIGIMDWPVGENKHSVGARHGVTSQDIPDIVGTRHGVSLQEEGRIKFGNPKAGSISTIVNHYKGSVTREARKGDNYDFAWHPRFHDHIVRNARTFNRIRDYIINNPLKWDSDKFHIG